MKRPDNIKLNEGLGEGQQSQEMTFNKQDKELFSLLKELAQQDVKIFKPENKVYIMRLKEIYSEDYRHLYSSIFNLMLGMDKEYSTVEGAKLYNLEYNLRSLYQYVKNDKTVNTELKKNVFKLCDHVSLEFARIAHWKQSEDSLSSKVKCIEENVNLSMGEAEKIKEKINQSKEVVDRVQKEADSLKTSQVTVLGIFIAIVMAFVTKLVSDVNIFSLILHTPWWQVALLLCLMGMMTFNGIYLLLYVVGQLIGKNIGAACNSANCYNCSYRCSWWEKIKKRHPYLGLFNCTLLVLIIVFIITG